MSAQAIHDEAVELYERGLRCQVELSHGLEDLTGDARVTAEAVRVTAIATADACDHVFTAVAANSPGADGIAARWLDIARNTWNQCEATADRLMDLVLDHDGAGDFGPEA